MKIKSTFCLPWHELLFLSIILIENDRKYFFYYLLGDIRIKQGRQVFFNGFFAINKTIKKKFVN